MVRLSYGFPLNYQSWQDRGWQLLSVKASLSPNSWGQQFTEHPYSITATFIFFFHPINFGALARRLLHFFGRGWYGGKQKAHRGYGGKRYWGSPAVALLLFVFPPSLTVLCPSATWRLQIKENTSLMPSSTGETFLKSSPFPTPSSSVLSFALIPSRARDPGSLPSACLWNLWTEPRYALGMLQLNAFPFFFIPHLSLSPLGFENSCDEYCFPTKQVASCAAHVSPDWRKNKKKCFYTSFFFTNI